MKQNHSTDKRKNMSVHTLPKRVLQGYYNLLKGKMFGEYAYLSRHSRVWYY